MKNNIIITDQIPNQTGALVHWRLSGEPLSLEATREACKAAGLLAPKPTTLSDAMHYAVHDLFARAHTIIRKHPAGGFAIVTESTTEEEDLLYSVSCRVEAEMVAGRVHVTVENDAENSAANSAIKERLEELVTVALGQIRPIQISAWLCHVASHLNGVTMRERGGMYFIPSTTLPQWRQYAEIVRGGAHKVYEIPALAVESAIEAVVDGLTDEILSNADAIQGLAESNQQARSLRAREREAIHLHQKVLHYEELLGRKLEELTTRTMELKGVVAERISVLGVEL